MNDYTFASLTTAVNGFNSSVAFQIQTTDPYIISTTNGTISVGNLLGLTLNISNDTSPGWLTGRRPVSGKLFPRGVYNK
jgi:hypothetical protein